MAKDELVLLWTSADREVAVQMAFMYAGNSMRLGWWREVTLLIWGPSARLAAQDPEIRQHLPGLAEAGVRLLACRKCADNYGASAALEAAGVTVVYTGELLTRWIKEGKAVLSV
ncbi:MAG: DsrE family protein [Thermodesulfobacteriota bacterium]